MNSVKLLRVGMPVLGLCVFAALQSGCRSEVLGDRPSVPVAEREPAANDNNFNDDSLNADDAFAAPKKDAAKKAASANGKNAKDSKSFVYPRFEDTENKPIYSAPKKAAKAKPAAPGSLYTVVRGDSLGKIAARHRVKTIDLAKENDLQLTSVIRVGQKLRIPGGKAAVKSADKSVAKTAAKSADSNVRSGLYTVRKGDSIARIAKRLKVKRADLMAANNLNEQSILRIGQTLKLPGAQVVNDESVVVDNSSSAAEKNDSAAAETAAETKATSAEDDIVKEIDGEAAAGSNNAADSAASTTAAAAAGAAVQKDVSNVTSVEVLNDITIDNFCKRYGVSKEDVFRLNSDIKDGVTVIKAGTVVSIP